MHFPIL